MIVGRSLKNILGRVVQPKPQEFIFLLSVGLITFSLYAQTLVPSFLDGDPGHFQYIPQVLGISYPPGFPLYILFGHLWSLLPLGTWAWRMNLFSALFGALTISITFLILRRQGIRLMVAIGAAFLLAVLPPFWHYSTFAAEYTLHTFLSLIFLLLLAEWKETRETKWVYLALFVGGMGVSNHPTFWLYAPASIIFFLIAGGRTLLSHFDFYLKGASAFLMPLLVYLYLPVRAGQLLASPDYVLENWHRAVAQGLVTPFYQNNAEGFFQFITAQAFIKNIAGLANENTLILLWGTNLIQVLTIPLVVLALFGIIQLARNRPHIAVWLVIVFLTFTLVTTRYVSSALPNVDDVTPFLSKFALPIYAFMIVSAGWGIASILGALQSAVTRVRNARLASLTLILLPLATFIYFIFGSMSNYSNALIERSEEIEQKWRSIQEFPPEKNSVVVAHWGDLTPLWYLQNAEEWRRDLVALFPPTDEQIAQWLATGKPLYLAGSLLEWAPETKHLYHFTPWGMLVRVTPDKLNPVSPLSNSVDLTLKDSEPRLRLLGLDITNQIPNQKRTIQVALFWEVLNQLSTQDYLVNISLENADHSLKPEQGDLLAVDWLPNRILPQRQRLLSFHAVKIPLDAPPGRFDIRLRVYSLNTSRNLLFEMEDQAPDYLDLGEISLP